MIALLAQAAELADKIPGVDWSAWAQFGLGGVVTIWLIFKGIPAILKEHRDEMKEVRTWHENEVRNVRQDSERKLEAICEDSAQNRDAFLRSVEKLTGK